MQKICRTFTSTCFSITLTIVATTWVLHMVQYSFEIVPSLTKIPSAPISIAHFFSHHRFYTILVCSVIFSLPRSNSIVHSQSLFNFQISCGIADDFAFVLFCISREKKCALRNLHHPALAAITNEFQRFDRRFPSSQVLLLFFYLRNFPSPYIRYP